MIWINSLCRPLDQARAAIGAKVKCPDTGLIYTCDEHNDLGVLYWRHPTNGKQYTNKHLDYLAGFEGAY